MCMCCVCVRDGNEGKSKSLKVGFRGPSVASGGVQGQGPGGDQGAEGLFYIESFQPEWCISTMIYSRDTPFWSEILDI